MFLSWAAIFGDNRKRRVGVFQVFPFRAVFDRAPVSVVARQWANCGLAACAGWPLFQTEILSKEEGRGRLRGGVDGEQRREQQGNDHGAHLGVDYAGEALP